MIKKALEFYLGIKESNQENSKLILETYNNVLEIKDLIKKIEENVGIIINILQMF